MLKKAWFFAITFGIISVALVPGRPAFAADEKWTAKYWNNKNLSGTPVVERQESAINYDWGSGKPADGVPKDKFSARWTRTVNFSAGTYRFSATSDDGMRVWVDGNKIIDQWFDHAVQTTTADLKLSAGDHKIKVEYYENVGGATAKFSWSQAPATIKKWQGEYFNNKRLDGTPVLVRDDESVKFDWGDKSPAPGIVNRDNFSVRWKRTLNFSAGTYRFKATSDDGIRVWVDGNRIIDGWYDHTVQSFTADVTLASGDHKVKVEYYDSTGQAVAKLSWEAVTAPTTPITNWQGEYFNNLSLSGTPALVRDDANINFDWGANAPAAGINADNFSVRWKRTLNFGAATYRFTVTSDDGVRLWVDGNLIIDRWYDRAVQTFTADVALAAGDHKIKVEYYENVGLAVAKLSWTVATAPAPAPGTPPPVAGGAILVDNSDKGFVSGGLTSDWFTMTDGYNGGSQWSNNVYQADNAYNWARWYPMTLNAGKYEVFVYIPGSNATTKAARYWVHTSGGYTLKIIDQSANLGKWVSLGTFYFSGASYEFVSLSDVTYEATNTTRVAYDAVKWELR